MKLELTRRQILRLAASGTAGSLGFGLSHARAQSRAPGTDFAPRAKRIIFMYMSGAPSQHETFDYKPGLRALNGQELPPSVRGQQRQTTMTSGLPFIIRPSSANFSQHGDSGAWVSDWLPQTAQLVDRMTFIRSMVTDAINHDPASSLMHTGAQEVGRPSLGAWLQYALGTGSSDLPNFVVMTSKGPYPDAQPIHQRLWGAGFLAPEHQGVRLRAGSDPVLYLNAPVQSEPAQSQQRLQTLKALNDLRAPLRPAGVVAARNRSYELAHAMQSSIPELVDLSSESAASMAHYGPDVQRPGTFARHCLLARRFVERGARTVLLVHRGWDHHKSVLNNTPTLCQETDYGAAGLLRDLDERGLLDETLVVWGGEFGRTVYGQGGTSMNFGRDHHPGCFTMWMAGGGVKPGLQYGLSDEFSFNVVENRVHVHDLHATILHLFGLDHTRLTARHQGRDFRLTDVGGRVLTELIA